METVIAVFLGLFLTSIGVFAYWRIDKDYKEAKRK